MNVRRETIKFAPHEVLAMYLEPEWFLDACGEQDAYVPSLLAQIQRLARGRVKAPDHAVCDLFWREDGLTIEVGWVE
jgi:hypothetical protein